jgi:hypothetical protein
VFAASGIKDAEIMSILAGHYTEDSLLQELQQHGVKKTKRTLRVWRAGREGPPFTKLGRTVLYPADGFLAWLKSHTQQPVRERRQQHRT